MASQPQHTHHSTITDSLNRMRKAIIHRPYRQRIVSHGNGIINDNALAADDRDAEGNVGENLVKYCRVRHSGGEPGLFEDFEGWVLCDVDCGVLLVSCPLTCFHFISFHTQSRTIYLNALPWSISQYSVMSIFTG